MEQVSYTQLMAMFIADQERKVESMKPVLAFIQNKTASLNANLAVECMNKSKLYLTRALYAETCTVFEPKLQEEPPTPGMDIGEATLIPGTDHTKEGAE